MKEMTTNQTVLVWKIYDN